MEGYKSKKEQIKESLKILILKLEQEEGFTSIKGHLKNFQNEFELDKPNKENMLFFLDEVFKSIIKQFPNMSQVKEEDKKIVDIINKFNSLCQDYINN
jgi:hypothetical protein